jgi:PEP-CTERM motif
VKNLLPKILKITVALSVLGFATLNDTHSAHAQEIMYGYDNTNKQLVTINPVNATVTPIGFSGLSSTSTINALAYHIPTETLFGTGSDTSDGSMHFYRFDKSTGTGTNIANLGSFGSSADGLEYITGNINSMILFKSPNLNFYGTDLNTISTIGTLTFTGISTANTHDNDSGVYDSLRSKYYSMDDNIGTLEEVNLLTGATITHGSLNGFQGDGAYSPNLDKIFHTTPGGGALFQINANTPGSPGTLVGQFGTRSIRGIAISSSAAPEPGTFVLIALGGAGLVARRRRCKA